MRSSRTKSNEVSLSNIESRPIEKVIVKKGGQEIRVKLNDSELVKESVKSIDDYINEHGELPQGMTGTFIQWLREAADAVEKGESVVAYKRKTITRTIPDYSALKNVTK